MRRPKPPKPFLLESTSAPQSFLRGGVRAYFDPCRRILVRATPEEGVRQQLLAYLTLELGIPAHLVRTELHLSHLTGAAGRGRIDVVVSHQDGAPLLLVECKAPHVALDDDGLDQVLRYHAATGAVEALVGITNGAEARWYRLTKEGRPQQLTHAPRLGDLLRGALPADLAPQELPLRPRGLGLSERTRRWMLDQGVLGEGSPAEHHEYLANLAGLLLLERAPPTLRGRADRFTVRSSGLRTTSFGNAAGGSWGGTYRYFLIEDAAGEAQIVSLSIMGKMLVRDHPMFGNTNGCTTLVVAVDDFDKRHSSLQLDLDRFVAVGGGTMTLWHDGTLTRGKMGAARRDDVVRFVRQRAPHLVDGARVHLGSVPATRLVRWEDVEGLLANIIEYALVRDEYRRASA